MDTQGAGTASNAVPVMAHGACNRLGLIEGLINRKVCVGKNF